MNIHLIAILIAAFASSTAFAGEINSIARPTTATLTQGSCRYSNVHFENFESPVFPIVSVLRERFPGLANQWTPVEPSRIRIISRRDGTYSVTIIDESIAFAPEGKCSDMKVKLLYSVPADK